MYQQCEEQILNRFFFWSSHACSGDRLLLIRYEDSKPQPELLELLDDESELADWAASAAALDVALALPVRLAGTAALALIAPLAFALGEAPSLLGVDGVVPDELDEEDDELLGDLRDLPAVA